MLLNPPQWQKKMVLFQLTCLCSEQKEPGWARRVISNLGSLPTEAAQMIQCVAMGTCISVIKLVQYPCASGLAGHGHQAYLLFSSHMGQTSIVRVWPCPSLCPYEGFPENIQDPPGHFPMYLLQGTCFIRELLGDLQRSFPNPTILILKVSAFLS